MHSRHSVRRLLGWGFPLERGAGKIEGVHEAPLHPLNAAPRRLARVASAALLALLWAPLVLAGLGACSGPAREPDTPATVTHVRVEGALDVGTMGVLRRAFAHAARNRHGRLVIEIDTLGGSMETMYKLARMIDDRGSPELIVVAWINDHAISAGVLLALACDEIYMTPEATIGDAMPIAITPLGPVEVPEQDNLKEKLMSATRAEFRAMAEKRGRPAELAEAMIDPEIEIREVEVEGVRRIVDGRAYDDARSRGDEVVMLRTLAQRGELLTLTASRAIELGFVDGRAEDLSVLLEKIGQAGAQVDFVERARSEDLLALLDRLSLFLVAAGLMLAWMEIKSPGFGLPGVLAIACFALLLVGRYLTGLADIPHVVAVTLGLALIAVEIFVLPGTLWAGIVGGALVLGGLVVASLGPGFGVASEMQRALLLDASFRVALSASLGLVGALILSRFLPRTPVLRGLVLDPDRDPELGPGRDPARSGMRAGPVFAEAPDVVGGAARVGAEGVAFTALRPVGKVVLDGAAELEFEGRAAGRLIDGGERVRVVEVSEGRLVVEPL